jgi:hypothetical protein
VDPKSAAVLRTGDLPPGAVLRVAARLSSTLPLVAYEVTRTIFIEVGVPTDFSGEETFWAEPTVYDLAT